jgi:CRISPR-associated endonuclease/helicase Cas3
MRELAPDDLSGDVWHKGQDIRLLATMAGLLHDIGKACIEFQRRLEHSVFERNQYRHEWISLRLFEAFVGAADTDESWLRRLIEPTAQDDAAWLDRLVRDGVDATKSMPLARLPPLARAIGWLVLTHHRLPVLPPEKGGGNDRRLGSSVMIFQAARLDDLPSKIGPEWNELPTSTDAKLLMPYWSFECLPVTSRAWRTCAAEVAKQLLALVERQSATTWLMDPYVMHLARLSLMLADHHYSSLVENDVREKGDDDHPLYANTLAKGGGRLQRLDEHLIGVGKHASVVACALPHFESALPRLKRYDGLRQHSTTEAFRWQDLACEAAASLREHASRHGAFIVNMASTGRGKTLANARIMNALADPERGLRCSFAMGLRTLTLQTGRALRDRLQLNDDEIAIRVGGAEARALFEHYERFAERSGSVSSQALLSEDSHVFYEGDTSDPLLQRAFRDPKVRALLAAPVLVCTVDHLAPATEAQRAGRQIAPMLRLMSSDLVLDELDDFDLDDIPALTRLVYWAGLLGTRVLLSSATLPPALVQGMYEAYLEGRRHFQANRGEVPGEKPVVPCAWFDEFHQQVEQCADGEAFKSAHAVYAQRRCERLGREEVRRRLRLVDFLPKAGTRPEIRAHFARCALDNALELHAQHHSVDPRSGKRVSFGLVRMANIDRLFDVAQALFRLGAPEGVHIHLCVYHSQHPLLVRSAIERRLDAALDRHQPGAVFELPDVRRYIDSTPEIDQLFVVLGSPVTEVGRDHCYDWAAVEPSSMRSMIQLAGRVRRHRAGECMTPNIVVFSHNLRHYERRNEAAYCRPGFEGEEEFRLRTHDLRLLLHDDEKDVVDARPRIVARAKPEPRQRLTDLEHRRIENLTLARIHAESAALFWTHPFAHLCAVAQQQQPFRKQSIKEVELLLLPNGEEDDYRLIRLSDKPGEFEADADGLNQRLGDDCVRGERISPWGAASYLDELAALAADLEQPLDECARRFGKISLPKNDQGWRSHPVLGFTIAR